MDCGQARRRGGREGGREGGRLPEWARGAGDGAFAGGCVPRGWDRKRGAEGEGGREEGVDHSSCLTFHHAQIEAMRQPTSSLPTSFGSSFLTLAVNTSAVFAAQHPVEAFQVSQQAVQMVWDGLIAEGGAEGVVKTTR